MLRSQQGSAPAHNSLKRVNDEASVHFQSDLSSQQNSAHSLFWPPSDITDAGIPLHSFKTTNSSAFDLDATPKTASQFFLESTDGRSCTDLLHLGLSSLDPGPTSPSGPPSATTVAVSENNAFPSSISGYESSPAMSTGSNYNFETPSLHQVPALTAPFATSSPTVGSIGTVEANSGKASPSQYEQGWNHQNAHDRRSGLESPEETLSTFQTHYAHKNLAASGAHQTHHAHSSQFNGHDYHAHASHPGLPQYFQHRASISGPLMDSTAYAERYESSAAAPPRVHGLAAWENASGSARPHTADGMFGQFGVLGTGAASHEGSAESSVVGNSTSSSSRPYTPGGHAANPDAYYQNRRMSMPDPSTGKVFSYMGSGEDGGMLPSSGMGVSSHNYGGQYFGGGYGAGGSKKRPRRRYDEIERLYPCSWPGCTKSYGTLNHLNAHVAMQKHGPKRSPSEFKDMRKAWRKQKKEEEQRRQSRQMSLSEQTLRPSFSGSSYADMASGQAELVGGSSGNSSVLPIAPPAALGGFGSQHAAGGVPGMNQLPGSMAHLSRYSMSSVSTTPTAAPPFYLNSGSGDSGLHSSAQASSLGQQHQDHSHNAAPLQCTGDSRLPYNPPSHYNNMGAYLSAHRGSA